MTIKTTRTNGSNAGRGDNPHRWHPSMGTPPPMAGGGGKKPPKTTKTITGGSGDKPSNGDSSKSSGNYDNVYNLADHAKYNWND